MFDKGIYITDNTYNTFFVVHTQVCVCTKCTSTGAESIIPLS